MSEPIKWVTVNGNHIPIYEGYTKLEAVRDFYKKKKYDDSKFEFLPDDEDKAYDAYEEMSDISYNNLAPADVYKIQGDYLKKEASWEFNEKLRNGEKVDLTLRNALDRACESYTAEKDMASQRMVSLDYLRNAYGLDIPRFGDVDRSKIANQMKSYIGSELSSKSFTSVSLHPDGTSMFNNLAVKMKINLPKGTPMYVADNIGEYEAILGRNTKMVLKSVGFENSKIRGMEKEYGKVLLIYEVVKQ